MKYETKKCELVNSRDAGLRNWDAWVGHKQLIDTALNRYLQKPNDNSLDHLKQSLSIYRDGFEQQRFRPPTAGIHQTDNNPPEVYRFRK